MDHVFVCYVDPDDFVKDSAYTFSQKEVENIAELTDERTMNDSIALEMFKKYDNPFWFIDSVYDNFGLVGKIKLEIHANLSETDSKIVAKEFNNKVAEVIKTLIGKELMN